MGECNDGKCGESQGCGCGQQSCNCGAQSSASQDCGCGQQNCNCSQGCGTQACGQEYDKFMWMLHLAKKAKKELIKEKIKKKLDAEHGKKFDEIASLLVEALDLIKKDEKNAEKNIEEMRAKFYSILEK